MAVTYATGPAPTSATATTGLGRAPVSVSRPTDGRTRAPERSENHAREDHHRQREKHLEQTGEHVIRGTPKVRGDEPERRAQDSRSNAAVGAMMSISRPPTMTRANESRPSESVPNQCSPDGAASALSGSAGRGSFDAIRPPNTAHSTQNPTMTVPAMNVRDRPEPPDLLATGPPRPVSERRAGQRPAQVLGDQQPLARRQPLAAPGPSDHAAT